MVKKVPDNPNLSRATTLGPFSAVLSQILNNLSYRVNRLLSLDGADSMTGPMPLLSSTVSEAQTGGTPLWPAASWTGALLYISDETGGSTVAFSDGTDWRRTQDRVIIS